MSPNVNHWAPIDIGIDLWTTGFASSVIKYFFTFFAHTHLPKTKLFLKYPIFGIIAVTLVVISENKTTTKTKKKQQKYQHFISVYLVWFSEGNSHYDAICLKLRYFLFRCHNSHWRLLLLLLFVFLLILALLNKFSLTFVISVFFFHDWSLSYCWHEHSLNLSIGHCKSLYFRALWHFKIAISIYKFHKNIWTHNLLVFVYNNVYTTGCTNVKSLMNK